MYEPSRHIIDFSIAGFQYWDGVEALPHLTLGCALSLKAEPDNPFDPQAVAVYYGETKLGFVPRAKNDAVFSLVYFGYEGALETKVIMMDPTAHPSRQIRVAVKLKDARTNACGHPVRTS